MGGSVWELALILVIVFVLFGAGKLPKVMGDIGKGIKSLRDGLHDENKPESDEKKETSSK